MNDNIYKLFLNFLKFEDYPIDDSEDTKNKLFKLNNYSCWLGFNGGRGVATSLGILLTLMPLTSLLVFAVWALIVFITRYVSLGSIIGAALTPILAYYFEYDLKIQLFSGFMALLVIVGHKDNIKRLLTGTENKIKSGNMNNIKK